MPTISTNCSIYNQCIFLSTVLASNLISLSICLSMDKKLLITSFQFITSHLTLLLTLLSRIQRVDLVFSHFPFYFYFLFNLFFIFLFLELRTRVSDDITQSYISNIRWHSDCNSHKSQVTGKNIEDFGRMTSYNILNVCWPWGIHMTI